MKKNKYTEGQIAFALKQDELGELISEVVENPALLSRHFTDRTSNLFISCCP